MRVTTLVALMEPGLYAPLSNTITIARKSHINVWRLMTHHEHRHEALTWSRQNRRIAIGWGAIGDMRKQAFRSPEAIADAIVSTNHPFRNSGSGGVNLWDFIK